MVSLIADAICEGKNLPVENVAEEEGEDITMKDVIKKVEEDAAEYERRRRAKFEEHRQQMGNNNRRGSYNGERRVFRRDANGNRAAAKPAEGTTAPAAPKAEVKAEVKEDKD
jgi:hypothetical protein